MLSNRADGALPPHIYTCGLSGNRGESQVLRAGPQPQGADGAEHPHLAGRNGSNEELEPGGEAAQGW